VAIDQSEPGHEPADGRRSAAVAGQVEAVRDERQPADDGPDDRADVGADDPPGDGVIAQGTEAVSLSKEPDPELAGEPADEPADEAQPQAGDGPAGETPTQPSLIYRVAPYFAYLALAIYLLNDLWGSPSGFMLLDNYQDQVFFEWLLTNGANAIAHGDNPLFTDKLNAPYGLNLMANTSVLALSLPLAPITLFFGADVTFAVITTMALAGTASSWCFVLNRLLNHRVAAAIGGLFCGFAPAMLSQATGHPNISGQYVLPFVVLAALRLGEPGRRPVMRGLILGGLVVVQVFINEELLFLTALAVFVFLVPYAFTRPRELAQRVPDALKSLGTTVLVAGAALAWPLHQQFFGKGNYRGLPDYILLYGADLGSYWTFARRSVAGDPLVTAKLAQGATEENSFFGWPLLLALLVVLIWLWRDAIVRSLAVTGLVFALLSLGSEPKKGGEPFDIIAPWGWLDGLPLFDSVVPTRLALVVTPVIGCMLAIAASRFDEAVRRRTSLTVEGETAAEGMVVRLLGVIVLAMVLGPLTPTPLPVFPRPYVPPFFTTAMYKDHIPRDGVVLGVPPGWSPNLHSMQWQTAADLDFRIFGGYYLAPNPNDPERVAMLGPVYPPTMTMLSQVAEQGARVNVTPEVRAQAATDFRSIGVTTLVLPAHHWRAEDLRTVVDGIAGPGELVGGMWVWDVRPLTT
jgi:hypothetical protein